MSKTQHTAKDFKVGEQVLDLSDIQGMVIEGAPTSLVRVAFGPNGTHWRDLNPNQLTKVKTGQHTPEKFDSKEFIQTMYSIKDCHMDNADLRFSGDDLIELIGEAISTNNKYELVETAAERDRLEEENQNLLLEHGRISDELSILGSKYWEISRGLEGWEGEADKYKALNSELLAALESLQEFVLEGESEEADPDYDLLMLKVAKAIRKAKSQ